VEGPAEGLVATSGDTGDRAEGKDRRPATSPTGYAAVALSSNRSSSADSVVQRSNFTFTSASNGKVVPTSNPAVPVTCIGYAVQYYPVSAGTTYVVALPAGSVSLTPSGGAASAPPRTVSYRATTASSG